MAEPQPSTIQEGASSPHAPTSTSEDRRAADALSSLDTQPEDDTSKKNVDIKALGKAMKDFSVQEDDSSDKKKAVKVDAADVALLASELDLSKPRATELLKAHDGDAVKAMIAFVTSPACSR